MIGIKTTSNNIKQHQTKPPLRDAKQPLCAVVRCCAGFAIQHERVSGFAIRNYKIQLILLKQYRFSFRITNPNIQSGRIANPTERGDILALLDQSTFIQPPTAFALFHTSSRPLRSYSIDLPRNRAPIHPTAYEVPPSYMARSFPLHTMMKAIRTQDVSFPLSNVLSTLSAKIHNKYEIDKLFPYILLQQQTIPSAVDGIIIRGTGNGNQTERGMKS